MVVSFISPLIKANSTARRQQAEKMKASVSVTNITLLTLCCKNGQGEVQIHTSGILEGLASIDLTPTWTVLVSPSHCVWMFRHLDMARFSSLLGPLPITAPALVRFMIPSGFHWHLSCQRSGLISSWGLACRLNECVFSTFWVLVTMGKREKWTVFFNFLPRVPSWFYLFWS